MRELTQDEVTFELICEPEHIEIEGNCMASGDDAVDREAADWIREQLASGNEWAWCCVHVIARWQGYEGHDYLGGCSYRSEEEFTGERDAYYVSMKEQALGDLNRRIAECLAKCRMIEELLG